MVGCLAGCWCFYWFYCANRPVGRGCLVWFACGIVCVSVGFLFSVVFRVTGSWCSGLVFWSFWGGEGGCIGIVVYCECGAGLCEGGVFACFVWGRLLLGAWGGSVVGPASLWLGFTHLRVGLVRGVGVCGAGAMGGWGGGVFGGGGGGLLGGVGGGSVCVPARGWEESGVVLGWLFVVEGCWWGFGCFSVAFPWVIAVRGDCEGAWWWWVW